MLAAIEHKDVVAPRKQEIVMAYVLATGGRLPTNLDKLLSDMREMVGDISEADVRAAIKWALQQPKRPRRRSGSEPSISSAS